MYGGWGLLANRALEGVIARITEGRPDRQALCVRGFDLSQDIIDFSGSQVIAVDNKAVGLGTVGLFGAGPAAQGVVSIAVEVVDAVLVQRTQPKDRFWLFFFPPCRKKLLRAEECEGQYLLWGMLAIRSDGSAKFSKAGLICPRGILASNFLCSVWLVGMTSIAGIFLCNFRQIGQRILSPL